MAAHAGLAAWVELLAHHYTEVGLVEQALPQWQRAGRRAATRPVRLWHSQGKTTEARDLFAAVYGWFTEGFDAADLKEAKALLDELF